MSRQPGARRIDYTPGPAARAAMTAAAARFPDHNPQDLIDRLVIAGSSALLHEHWKPPALSGRNRHYWHPKARRHDEE